MDRVAIPARARGAAPWERTGAPVGAPASQDAQEKAERWQKAAGTVETRERDAARKERAAERRRRRAAAEAELQKKLENSARRMYYVGFFALPFVWLVNVLYFHREHKSEDANPEIKRYYKNSRLMFIIYTLLFIAWFTVFQVKKDSLRGLNILNFSGRSPGGI